MKFSRDAGNGPRVVVGKICACVRGKPQHKKGNSKPKTWIFGEGPTPKFVIGQQIGAYNYLFRLC